MPLAPSSSPVRRGLTVALLLGVAAAAPLAAQSDSTAASVSAYTAAQAARGQASYRTACAGCHAVTQFADPAFRRAWRGRTAWDLFEQLRTTMPNDNPGRLRRDAYADIVAYLFQLNGVPAGPTELGSQPEALRRVVFQPPPEPGP
jgi:mono/diheme cytochrome c family protein